MKSSSVVGFLIALISVVMTPVYSQAWAGSPLQLQKVTQDVYAIVGDLGNRSAENRGNNATFGFIVTVDGVVLIDSGGTEDGAKAIDSMIRQVTDQPVVKVINTGGQDHRWLGNDYFKKQGAQIIASKRAVEDQRARTNDQFFMLGNLVGEAAVKATKPVYAETTFDNDYGFELGGIEFIVRHQGPAHTPGDSFVWLPQQSVVFTGDIVYVDRLLGVLAYSNSKNWIDVFKTISGLKPKYVVPGHGAVTDMEQAKRDTYNYLVDLRSSVAEFMDNGGDISEIRQVDQSKYQYLQNFDTLSGRNAQRVFAEMEWE